MNNTHFEPYYVKTFLQNLITLLGNSIKRNYATKHNL